MCTGMFVLRMHLGCHGFSAPAHRGAQPSLEAGIPNSRASAAAPFQASTRVGLAWPLEGPQRPGAGCASSSQGLQTPCQVHSFPSRPRLPLIAQSSAVEVGTFLNVGRGVGTPASLLLLAFLPPSSTWRRDSPLSVLGHLGGGGASPRASGTPPRTRRTFTLSCRAASFLIVDSRAETWLRLCISRRGITMYFPKQDSPWPLSREGLRL